MITVRGCAFPTHLLYDVKNHVWYERLGDGSFRVGMDAVAVALAGDILAFTPRRVGRQVESGKACAVVESGKWVGPARIAFDGVVQAVNDAMIDNPSLANDDPYGKGYMLIARAADDAPVAGLVSGNELADAYEAWMAGADFAGCGAGD